MIGDNLKSQPMKFCKYVTSFRKINSASIQLEVAVKAAHLKYEEASP
jgi:hypothetical protein